MRTARSGLRSGGRSGPTSSPAWWWIFGIGPSPALRSTCHRSRKFPDRASALMCRTGAPGSVSQDFLRAFVGVVGRCARIDAECRPIDAASASGRATRRHDLDGRSQQRLLGAAAGASPSPPCRGSQPAGMESRRPGLESRPQDTRSDNVNGHDPNRNTRLRPSAPRLAKETATRARWLRRSARRHRPQSGPAVGKEAP